VLLHPPSLAFEYSASYGEMSRRSGVAAEADNHSALSVRLASLAHDRPREWNQTLLCGGEPLNLKL